MPSLFDRLWGRPAASSGLPDLTPHREAKAVTSIEPWSRGPTLESVSEEPQAKAARNLRAYRVGWFNKAGRKITGDLAALPWNVSDGDAESGDREAVIDKPDLYVPFASLSPIDQFQRLMEKPNPHQTGRVLRQKTQIRTDFGGAAFWYLEGSGLPTAIYGISPSRMWPAINKAGELLGWIMDRDQPSGGVPFDRDEIIAFSAATADDQDWFGVSVVEAVYSQVPLTDQIARHTADVLTTGGRLAGMLWPKERSLDEAEFTDAQRAWRNVTSDANAARRLLLFPEPMEWAGGASTPAEIGIPELAALNRLEICTAFPIDERMLGVVHPDGMNASGESRRELRREYWQGTIHPRADLMQEVIQTELLSRYERVMGARFNFQIEEPNLDDASVLLEKSAAFRGLVSIGFDPKEAVKAVELEHIKWLGLPDLLDPAKQAAMAAQAAEAPDDGSRTVVRDDTPRDNTNTQQTIVGKATKGRDEVAAEGVLVLADFLDGQRDRVVSRLRDSLPASKALRSSFAKADPEWWDVVVEDAALTNALRSIYFESGRASLQVVADGLDRVVPNKAIDRVMADLLAYGGERIADINARTLQAIVTELAEGTRRGYSVTQLIDGVPDEGFKGVLNAGLDNGAVVWGDARAEMIARTETALSYNRAALDGYREFRVARVLAYDGDGDPECAARNGHEFSVDDAFGIADHPNGTLDWAPVIEKSIDHTPEFIAAIKAIAERPTPDVNVHLPEVHVDAPVFTVNPPDFTEVAEAISGLGAGIAEVEAAVKAQPAPVVNLPAPVVTVKAPVVNIPSVQDVRIVESTLPPVKRRIKKDRTGMYSVEE